MGRIFLDISGWNLLTKFFPSLFINLQMVKSIFQRHCVKPYKTKSAFIPEYSLGEDCVAGFQVFLGTTGTISVEL